MARRSKGEGSVYQRPDGRWVAQIDLGYDDEGRRVRPKRVRQTKKAAVEALNQLRRDAGIPAARENITVTEWMTLWLDDQRARWRAGQLAPKTVVGYDTDIRHHIGPHLGSVRLDQVTAAHVERMITQILASGRKPGTAAHVRRTLSAALAAARKEGLIEQNVVLDVPVPKRQKQEPSAFSADEMARITQACETDRLGAMWLLGMLTGMRASELCGLKWSDVDLDKGTYQVDRTLHRIGASGAAALGTDPGLVLGAPKTELSGKKTPLSPSVVELLKRHRTAQAKERLAASGWTDSGHIFTSRTGTPIDPSRNARTAFDRMLARADVPNRTADGRGRGLHELRRTFTTVLRDQDVPLEDVQRLGRWTSPTVLLELYAAVDEKRLRAAADRASSALDAGSL